MEDLEGDHVELTEDELFTGLTEALVRDAPLFASTLTTTLRFELDRQVRSLTFERDQARALMWTTLARRDTAYAERDATFVARDEAFADRDAHRAYAEEVVGQARHVLERQDGTVRTTMTLFKCINTIEQELRFAT